MKYIILIGSLIIAFILSNMGIKPVSNFMNNNELLPIFTGTLIADLITAFITLSGVLFTRKTLQNWYKKYRLSAVIADIFIIVLVLILLRYILNILNIKVSLFQFILNKQLLCLDNAK